MTARLGPTRDVIRTPYRREDGTEMRVKVDTGPKPGAEARAAPALPPTGPFDEEPP
jgi:hypothetical protein